MAVPTTSASDLLRPYLPRLVVDWLRATPTARLREVAGTLAFVDISGFTKMSEQLARNGKAGAEELADILDDTFAMLLAVAYADGAGLVKWGGDAVLLLFDGPGHEARACRACLGMQAALERSGPIRTSAGRVRLRMSIGVHSGTFHFALVGDVHRELIICGPGATATVALESAAEAGEVLIGETTATALPATALGASRGGGILLVGEPDTAAARAPDVGAVGDVDLVSCIPVALRERLLSGSREAEHRAVTVAFLEFAGTDGLLATEGPDALADALDGLVRAVQAAAARHEVSFHESDIARDGGKILLVAGAPRTTGSDEERVLHAALASARHEGPLRVRVGVNRGHVFSGILGPAYRRTFSIKGDAVNLAARVLGKAGTGQVLATEGVLERSRAPFLQEPLEPFLVKGKTVPVRAAVVGAPSRHRGGDRGRREPLVGRDAEVTVLQDAVARARAGNGGIVEIVGEAGIGKSRLVEETIAAAEGFTLIEVACEPYEASTPYRAARTVVRAAIGLAEEGEGAEALEHLRDRVRSAAPDLEPWLPLIASAVGLSAPPTPATRDLGQQASRAQLARAVAELLVRLIGAPVLVAVEDLHWMDEASGEIFRTLAADLHAHPCLVLATRRPVAAGVSPDGWPGVTSLRPEPLGAAAAAALIGLRSEDAPLAPHEVEELQRRAGGNPLFLRELVAAARRVGVEGLPDSIEAVIAAQIDELPAERRALLRRVAVLGQSFAEDLALGILDERPARPWAGLERFLRPDGRGQQRFVHALIRDAAYEGLSFRQRRVLHGRVGDALLVGDRSDGLDSAELLSLHFFAAQRYDEAWRYSRAAGERAQAKWANVEAAEFYERALESARRLRVQAGEEVAETAELLGDVRERLGRFDASAVAYTTARRLRRDDRPTQVRLLMKEGITRERTGRYTEALRWFGRALRLDDPDAPAPAHGELLIEHAGARFRQGRYRPAIRWCEVAVEHATRVGDRRALARAYAMLHVLHMSIGSPQKADYRNLALPIYEELGDVTRQGYVLNNLGMDAYYEGEWDTAVELYERARTALLRAGGWLEAADAAYNIAEILADQGHLEDAERRTREALTSHRAAGYPMGIAFSTVLLGRIAARDGRHADARALLEDAVARWRDIGDETHIVDAEAKLLEARLLAGDSHDAEARAEEALGRARRLEVVPSLIALLERIHGLARAQAGDAIAAVAPLERAVTVARAAGDRYELALALIGAVRATPSAPATAGRRREAESLLEGLGVVSLATVPLP